MRYRWFVDEEKQKDEFGVPVSRAAYDEALHPPRKTSLYGRKEVLAILVVIFIMLYEWNEDYSPITYMCVSFLTFEVRPLVAFFMGDKGRTVSNVLTGFSVAMFVAAAFWTLL